MVISGAIYGEHPDLVFGEASYAHGDGSDISAEVVGLKTFRQGWQTGLPDSPPATAAALTCGAHISGLHSRIGDGSDQTAELFEDIPFFKPEVVGSRIQVS